MKRTVLVFGLIAGAIVSAFMGTSMAIASCSHDTDFSMGMVIGYASMLIAFSFVFVGIKSYRDKYLGGSITYGQGFKVGFVIAVIASTMYVITWGIEYHYFMPDFMDQYGKHMIEQAVASGKPETEITAITQQMAEMKADYNKPAFFLAYTYAEILPVGLLVTLISAAILRKKKPTEPVFVTN